VIARLPRDSILVVPITDPTRFDAQDIMVYRGTSKRPDSLKGRYPAHFKNIAEVTQTYVAFRVCTIEKYRGQLSEPKTAQKIANLILAK